MESKNVYVGKRYVPKIIGDWDSTKNTEYESLSVVCWGGNSYTSKMDVPKGIDISNNVFWVKTGDYDVQIELYKHEVDNFKIFTNENLSDKESRIIKNTDDIENLTTNVSNAITSIVNKADNKLKIINFDDDAIESDSDILFLSNFGGWESTTIMESSTVKDKNGVYHLWYRSGESGEGVEPNNNAIGYAESLDGIHYKRYKNNPLKFEENKGCIFPTVFEYNENYYMVLKDGWKGGYYLYDVTNPIIPKILNNGNPILNSSLFNAGFVVINNVIHMLIEDVGINFGLKYSYAVFDINNLNFDENLTPIVIPYGGNPCLKYIPERNAILCVYGSANNGFWRITSCYAYLTDNLSLATSWHNSPALNIAETNIHIADPDIFVTHREGKDNIIINGTYNQMSNFQWYSPLTLLQFFDNIVTNNSLQLFSGLNNPTMDIDNNNWSYDNDRRLFQGMLIIKNDVPIYTRNKSFNTNPGIDVEFRVKKTNILSRICFIVRYIDKNNFARIWLNQTDNSLYYQEKINGGAWGENIFVCNDPIHDVLVEHKIEVIIGENGVNLIYVDNVYKGMIQSSSIFRNGFIKIGFSGYEYDVIYSNVKVKKHKFNPLRCDPPIIPTVLSNNWISYSPNEQQLCYWKDPLNNVHVKARIKGGVLNTVVYTLPEGYRPKTTQIIPSIGLLGLGITLISPSGDITPTIGDTTDFYIIDTPFLSGL